MLIIMSKNKQLYTCIRQAIIARHQAPPVTNLAPINKIILIDFEQRD